MSVSPESGSRMRVSIGWQLMVPFVLLIVFVLVVFLPLSTRLIAQRLEQEADSRLSQTAIAVGQLLEQSKSRVQLIATLIANLPEVEAIGEETELAREIIPLQKEQLNLQELSYYSAHHRAGNAALYYGGPLIVRRNLISERTLDIRDGLVARVQSELIPVSGIVIAPQSSQIIGVAPVLVNGKLTGIVMAVSLMDDSYLQEIGNVLDVDAAIVKDNAIIAAAIPQESGYVELAESGLIAADGSVRTLHIDYGDGIERRILAHPLIVDGLVQGTVLVVRSMQDVVDAQRQIQIVIFAFVGVMLLILVLYLMLVFLNFIQPLRRIAAAAARVSAGQLSIRVPDRRIRLEDEVVDITRNFNTMTARLEELYTGLEQKVTERTHELTEALGELQVKRDEALQASRTKSLFLANMSHELRTPLNAIIGYSEMLEEEARIQPEQAEAFESIVPDLQKIQKAGKHLLALINDILDISKIEAGKVELYLEEFLLTDLLDEIVATIQPLVDKNNNVLVYEPGENLGRFYSDMTRLRQIVFNLVSNAAKFTSDGTITMRVTREVIAHSEWLRIAIEDTGIGMTPEQASRVFQEFTQADASTTRKYGGTGLGLPISRHFSQMMGGDITVESEAGKGSTFTVLLPVRMAPAPGKRPAMESPPLVVPESPVIEDGDVLQNGQTVLLIDDEAAVHDVLTRLLQREGFRVLSAMNGDDGVQIAREQRPNVITLDVMMPSFDGWAVLSRLKTDPETADIPVVMLSIIENRSLGFALGAVDYLTKPVDRSQLLAVMQRFQKQEGADRRVLIVEDNLEVRELLQRTCEREGWSAATAENGRAALSELAVQLPDVVLLDLMMPQMDGFQFLTEVRANAAWRAIPIVVVTAKTLTEAERSMLSLNADRVLQKAAYSPNDLVDEIRLALNNRVSSQKWIDLEC